MYSGRPYQPYYYGDGLYRVIRRIRKAKVIVFAIAAAEIDLSRPNHSWLRPRGGWIPLAEAERLTGYSNDHLRGWILPQHKEIRRVKVAGQVYVVRRQILAYARRQRGRGYGPRPQKRCRGQGAGERRE